MAYSRPFSASTYHRPPWAYRGTGVPLTRISTFPSGYPPASEGRACVDTARDRTAATIETITPAQRAFMRTSCAENEDGRTTCSARLPGHPTPPRNVVVWHVISARNRTADPRPAVPSARHG